MIPRLMVAIILACVPLANGLDPTQLLSLPTGLLLCLVIWETVGSLERQARPIESWKDAENIDNYAECSASKETAKIDE
jgi:hypothetical protein